MIATCPTSDRLQDYVLGKLPEQESDELYGHLVGCDCCQQQLEARDSQDDSFVGQFKIDRESEGFHQEPAYWHATDRAKDIAELLSRRVFGDVAITGLDDLANGQGPESFPRFIGEYQVDRVLGRGGMGTVYLGHHTKLDRAVALKVISRHRLADPKTQGRFASEMKAVGRMNHPNIVAAHDAREVDGTAVLVTEYIDGLNVGSIIRRVGPLSVADATRIACDVAAALGAINDAGLIHRDIKPSNIMVSRAGQVKLLDLGLARLQDTNGELQEHTATGQALGTVDYIAPEQINEGRDVDVRADIYALGCTLFRMLTGQPVFDDVRYATAFAKMTAHVQVKPPSLGDIADNIPAPLVGLVAEMLQKDPAQRPQTPQALVERLEPFTTGANLSALVDLASKHEEKPRAAARSVSTSAAHRTSTQRGSFWSSRFFFLVGAGFGGAFLGLAMAWLMGIEITIKHADGTTTRLKVANGSVVTIDEQGNATVELSRSIRPLDSKNLEVPDGSIAPATSNPRTDSVVNGNPIPMPSGDESTRTLAVRRDKMLRTLSDPTKSKLDSLAGIWLTRAEGSKTFFILGREKYSMFVFPAGQERRGAWRSSGSSDRRPIFDLEIGKNQDGSPLFDLGAALRFRRFNEDLLTIYLPGFDNSRQRPHIGSPIAHRTEFRRADLSAIESIANPEETDAIFRILEDLIAEPDPDSEVSAQKQDLDDTINRPNAEPRISSSGMSGMSGGMSGMSGPPSGMAESSGPSNVFREIKAKEIQQLNGVWRFQNESRFQGAFLLVMNEKFAIVSGPQGMPSQSEDRGQDQTPGLVEFAGNVTFDPTTDPPQFDLQFTSGGPPDPMLGICQIIGNKEIRRTEKQVDGSDTPTVYAFPSEQVELKIWFAPPGKPRLTGPTLGNDIYQPQLVRIDMSETINEQELNNEIPAEVRTRWNAMSEQGVEKMPLTSSDETAVLNVPATDVVLPTDRISRQELTELRNEAFRILTERTRMSLHPLVGIWKFRGEGRQGPKFLILGREQYSVYGSMEEASRGEWRVGDSWNPLHFDLEVVGHKREGTTFQLGVAQSLRRTGSDQDYLEVFLSVPGNLDQRPQVGDDDAQYMDLERADMSIIESVANFAETGEVLRIWEELSAEPVSRKQVPTRETQQTESLFAEAKRVEQEMAADNEVEIKTLRSLAGVWRFQNTSRFKGAFLILYNNKFAVVGGPVEDNLAGNFLYNRKADPATFDLDFTSGGPTQSQLGICKQIMHWAIRTTTETTQTTLLTPVEHIELRIWLAVPGQSRLTQPGEGGEELRLLRIDMSGNTAPQEQPYEIPAEVREKYTEMVQQMALE